MLGIGPKELIVLAVILVMFFGVKRIPELARAVGDAIRHIRNGFSDEVKGDAIEKK